MIRPEDQATLDQLGLSYEVASDGSFVAVTIEGWPLPAGLEPRVGTLLILLPPGFNDAAPDMFWLDPPATNQGQPIPGTESMEIHAGRTWQRWSRHIQGAWRPGVDNLATYLAYVRRCLDQAAGRAA